MVVMSAGWSLDVDRGPDWLIVTPHPGDGTEWTCPRLAEDVWQLCTQHFTYRVVLDLGGLQVLPTALIGQLVRLQKRLCMKDGVLRLCGLTDYNRTVLRSCRLDGYFPQFHDREEAVMGSFVPAHPR